MSSTSALTAPGNQQGLFAVLGATGQIGGRVARQLLASGQRVRAVVRDTASTASLELKTLGAELFEVKVSDPSPYGTDAALLTDAFTGVDAAFIMMPFHMNVADVTKESMAFIDKVKQAVIASKIKKIVVLSSVAAHQPTGTGAIQKHYQVQQLFDSILESTNLAVTYVRAGYFFSNILSFLVTVPQGFFSGPIQNPDSKICPVSSDDIGDLVAQSLLDTSVLAGKSKWIELSGPEDVSNAEIATIITDIVGKPVVYVPMPKDQRQAIAESFGLSPDGASQFVETFDGYDNGMICYENASTVVRGKVSLKDYLAANIKQ